MAAKGKSAMGANGLPDPIALVKKLQERIAELEEENRQLRAAAKKDPPPPPAAKAPAATPPPPKKTGGIVGWLMAPVGSKDG